jgi:hypothetical protein
MIQRTVQFRDPPVMKVVENAGFNPAPIMDRHRCNPATDRRSITSRLVDYIVHNLFRESGFVPTDQVAAAWATCKRQLVVRLSFSVSHRLGYRPLPVHPAGERGS